MAGALKLKALRRLALRGTKIAALQGPPTRNQRYARLKDAKDVAVRTVRAILIRRGLESEMRKSEHPLCFWVAFNNALFDDAVLGWAILFGSDHGENQQIHWKNVFADHAGFRNRLQAHLGVSKSDFRRYWHEMKSYRDKAVAHHDEARWKKHTAYPIFDIALKSVAFYYQEVVAAFKAELGQEFEPTMMTAYLVSYQAHAQVVAESAVSATLMIAEYVDTTE